MDVTKGKKLKIIYCIDRLSTPGGMERVLSLKANHFADEGHEVHIITTEKGSKPPYFSLARSVRVHYLNVEENHSKQSFISKLIVGEIVNQEQYQKTKKLIEEIQPDICVSLFDSERSFLHKIKVKKIVEFHFSKQGLIVTSKVARFPKLMEWYYRFVEFPRYKKRIQQYDAFVTLTQQDYKDWGSLSHSLNIPNPITNEDIIQEVEVDYASKQVLTIGNIHYIKGYELLLEAWRKITIDCLDWNLIIVGRREGVKDNLDEIIKNKNIKNITVQPATNDVVKYYSSSSIYVCTSRCEGFSLAIAEAQSLGLPIVSFDCPVGPREIITHEEDGLLVDYLSIDDLVDKLKELMINIKKREKMGKNAKKNILRFSQEKIFKQWEELFERIIDEKSV